MLPMYLGLSECSFLWGYPSQFRLGVHFIYFTCLCGFFINLCLWKLYVLFLNKTVILFLLMAFASIIE